MSAADPTRDAADEIAVLRAAMALQEEYIEAASGAHAAFLARASRALAAGAPLAAQGPHISAPLEVEPLELLPSQVGPAQAPPLTRMGRFAVRPAPLAPGGWAVPGLLRDGARVVITPDGGGVAEALAALLAARGVRPRLTGEPPPDCDVLVHLGGLRETVTPEETSELCFDAFRVARAIAPGLAARGGAAVFVQDTGGDFGHAGSARAWSAGIAGLAKSVGWEWPAAHVRAVDVERGGRSAEAIAAQVLDELVAGGVEPEVGLRADGTRTIPRTEAIPLPLAPPLLGPDDVVLVTGGARGVTGACVIALAEESRSRFVLLGRTARVEEPASCAGIVERAHLTRRLFETAQARGEAVGPRQIEERVRALLALREVDATLQAVARAGGKARYVSVDILDEGALARAVAAVRAEWGPFTALVHGAGVNRDRRLLDKPEAEARAVYDTKVRGLQNALRATEGDPLRVLCAFSSISGRWGNAGQADYAMANEAVAKALAWERRRRPSLLVCRSLSWGPWDGGMVTPALRARWESAGVPVIPTDLGATMFERELSARTHDSEVVLGAEFATLVDGAAPVTAADVLLTPATHPELESHAVAGTPVVPVALVHEWMVRLARAHPLAPEHARTRGLRVLRGLRLERWDERGERLELRAELELPPGACARPLDAQSFSLALRDAAGALRYRGHVRCSREPVPPQPLEAPGALRDWDGPLYGPGRLFHGPMFQVMKAAACGPAGARAALRGGADAGWSGLAWRTDPALVDGALQLVGVWAQHQHGGAWLPTAVGALQSYAPGVLRGSFEAVLRGRRSEPDHVVADVWVHTADGTVVAELLEVEFHRYAA